MLVKTFKSINGEGPVELDSPSTLIICFFSKNKREDVVNLKNNFPMSTVIGCSSAGEIFNKEVSDNTLVVSLMKFKDTKFKVVEKSVAVAGQSFELGKAVYQSLEQADLKSIFVLSNGLQVNGTKLSEGLRHWNKEIPILGGLAGDGTEFKETLVFNNGKFIDGCVSIGLYGENLNVNHASSGGWISFGPKRKVTKSKDNILFELDNKPALALYKEYLGKEATNLPASGLFFPLSITHEKSKNVIRTILAVSEEDQSITFAGDVPEGADVRLMQADYRHIISAAKDAATAIGKKNGTNEYLAIAVSCVGRRLVLGEYIDSEVKELHEGLNNLNHLIGFYSYGEICPTTANNCEFHNQTMTLFTFSEDLDECA